MICPGVTQEDVAGRGLELKSADRGRDFIFCFEKYLAHCHYSLGAGVFARKQTKMVQGPTLPFSCGLTFLEVRSERVLLTASTQVRQLLWILLQGCPAHTLESPSLHLPHSQVGLHLSG